MYFYTYKMISPSGETMRLKKALSPLTPANFTFNREFKYQGYECFIVYSHEVTSSELVEYNQRVKQIRETNKPQAEQLEL